MYIINRAGRPSGRLAALALLAVSCVFPASAASPSLVEAATREGRVVVYSVLSNKAAQPLIDDFQSLYPGIVVDYDGEKGSNDMDARYRSEIAQAGVSADVVWSSATDMQMQLISEGHAARYRSPEKPALPSWAVYRDAAYGLTLEPVALVYNRLLLEGADIPRSHGDLARILGEQTSRFQGKVTGFDVRRSGVGLMFAAQDQRQYPGYARLLQQLGAAGMRPLPGTGDMLTRINGGSFLIGYNMMGSYALSRSMKDLPNLGVVFPGDYTLAFPRVAFISRHAAHPNAARLWLDYMLSARGQALLAAGPQLYPVRRGVPGPRSADALAGQLGSSLKIVPASPDLLRYIAPPAKAALIERWDSNIPEERKEP